MQSVQNQVCAGLFLRVCEGCFGGLTRQQNLKSGTRSWEGQADRSSITDTDVPDHNVIGFRIECSCSRRHLVLVSLPVHRHVYMFSCLFGT